MKHSTQAAIFAMVAHMMFTVGAILTFQLVQTMRELGTPTGIMITFAGISAVFAFAAIAIPVVIVNNVAGE